MFQTVEGRHGRGQAVLGVDITCPASEHRGWGTGCKSLILKGDGLYHCEDCGLVYVKPERYEKMEQAISTASCDCSVLEEVLEWYFNECYGYDCPILRYHCMTCGRHYKTPALADLEKQDSDGARSHVQSWIRFRQQEHAEKLSRIQDDVRRLAESLKGVSVEERQALLKPLFP